MATRGEIADVDGQGDLDFINCSAKQALPYQYGCGVSTNGQPIAYGQHLRLSSLMASEQAASFSVCTSRGTDDWVRKTTKTRRTGTTEESPRRTEFKTEQMSRPSARAHLLDRTRGFESRGLCRDSFSRSADIPRGDGNWHEKTKSSDKYEVRLSQVRAHFQHQREMTPITR